MLHEKVQRHELVSNIQSKQTIKIVRSLVRSATTHRRASVMQIYNILCVVRAHTHTSPTKTAQKAGDWTERKKPTTITTTAAATIAHNKTNNATNWQTYVNIMPTKRFDNMTFDYNTLKRTQSSFFFCMLPLILNISFKYFVQQMTQRPHPNWNRFNSEPKKKSVPFGIGQPKRSKSFSIF